MVAHLADGGMAEVVLGRLTGPSGFERAVVIKRILPHLARSRTFVDMFLDEARIVSRIRHRNVVQVHELGTDGDDHFLVMEYLEGESAGALSRRSLARHATPRSGLPTRQRSAASSSACCATLAPPSRASTSLEPWESYFSSASKRSASCFAGFGAAPP